MTDRFSSEFSTDVRNENVAFVVDMRPTTLVEQSLNDGFDRTNKPVGTPTTPGPEVQTTGGRGLGDYRDAVELGAIGRKK